MKKQTRLFAGAAALMLMAAACTSTAPRPSGQTPVQTKIQAEQKQQTEQAAVQKPQTKGESGLITVTQEVLGGGAAEQPYQVAPGTNALALLQKKHTVETKDYSSLGKFVTAIDGTAAGSKQFWEFMVNGKSSSVGAGSYVLKNGDAVQWKLSNVGSYK